MSIIFWTSKTLFGRPKQFLDVQKVFWTSKTFVGRPKTFLGVQKTFFDVQKLFWTSKNIFGRPNLFWTSKQFVGRPNFFCDRKWSCCNKMCPIIAEAFGDLKVAPWRSASPDFGRPNILSDVQQLFLGVQICFWTLKKKLLTVQKLFGTSKEINLVLAK